MVTHQMEDNYAAFGQVHLFSTRTNSTVLISRVQSYTLVHHVTVSFPATPLHVHVSNLMYFDYAATVHILTHMF